MKTYPMKARIRNEGTGPARVDIFDDVGSDGWGGGISAQDFAAQMAQVHGPLEVHINSYGGDVFAGQTMAEAIRNHTGPVTTKIDGIAASIASVIAQAGKKRAIAKGGLVYVHDAWSMAAGNAADMRAEAETLDKVSNVLAGEYARRAGGTAEQWRGVMQATKWYDAQEALDAGLVDEISGGAAQCPPGMDVESLAAHAPGRIMAALRSMPRAAMSEEVPSQGGDLADGDGTAPSGAKCKTCKGTGRLKHPGTGKPGVKCPGCDGSGTYDPDDDGDDDSTAGGDTDHDYVLPDGSPGPKAKVGEWTFAQLRDALRAPVAEWLREEVAAAAARLPVLAAAVDDSPWDASKAWHGGAQADNPEAFYRGICAGHHTSGDPGTQAYWALPYRYTPDGPPNAGGVRSAWGVLNGAMGGVNDLADRDAVTAKVKGLMKQVSPDWTPDDSTTNSVFSQRLREMRGAMPPLRGEGA